MADCKYVMRKYLLLYNEWCDVAIELYLNFSVEKFLEDENSFSTIRWWLLPIIIINFFNKYYCHYLLLSILLDKLFLNIKVLRVLIIID